jgi:translation elongation factor EF-G
VPSNHPIGAKLARQAPGEGRFAGWSDGHGHYGHVKIRAYPGQPGSGFGFENQIAGASIPAQFIPAIERGLREAVAVYRVDDVRVVLVDGSYHDIDSSDFSFMRAAGIAFDDAVKKAGLVTDSGDDDDGLSGVTEPREPRPAPRQSSVALPEPDDTTSS